MRLCALRNCTTRPLAFSQRGGYLADVDHRSADRRRPAFPNATLERGSNAVGEAKSDAAVRA